MKNKIKRISDVEKQYVSQTLNEFATSRNGLFTNRDKINSPNIIVNIL